MRRPDEQQSDPAALLSGWLDFYRGTVVERVRALAVADPEEVRRARLPSGWTPLELLSHLVHMERRWVVWGFLGEQVGDPWGDGQERWRVPDEVGVADLVAALEDVSRRTAEVLATHALPEVAATGGRFGDDQDPPTLGWVGFHVLQEWARHAGHLDVVAELAGGPTGE